MTFFPSQLAGDFSLYAHFSVPNIWGAMIGVEFEKGAMSRKRLGTTALGLLDDRDYAESMAMSRDGLNL